MARSLIVSSRLALLAAVGAAVGGAACSSAESPAAANTAPAVIDIGRENVVTVQTAEITVGPLISGDLRAQREATVRAELGGSVLQVVPDEGQAVKQGALLARIEARTQEDALRSAQSMVRSAEESLSVAERELARTERLVKGGALAERELEAARNAAVLARAQRDDAQSRLASAQQGADGRDGARADCRAWSRAVTSTAATSSARATELYTIIDPSSMRLEASVPSEQLSAITIGATVNFQVRGYPGQTFAGRIERISPMADPVTRQVPIFVTIPNAQGRLVAGLFAEGRVVQEVKRALVVPITAINERSRRAVGAARARRQDREGRGHARAARRTDRTRGDRRRRVRRRRAAGWGLAGHDAGHAREGACGGAGRRRGLTCSSQIFRSGVRSSPSSACWRWWCSASSRSSS